MSKKAQCMLCARVNQKTRTKDVHKDTSEAILMMFIVYPLYNSYQNRSINKSKKELAINKGRRM